MVAAVSPVGLEAAGEWALGGSVACDLEGAGLGVLLAQNGLPLRVGVVDGVCHEEQLMDRWAAQSGGKPA